QREGRVAVISTATDTVTGTIVLGPCFDTGFKSNGQLAPASATSTGAIVSTNPETFTVPTACFPNQLAGVAIRPGSSKAFVVSIGAPPNGPLHFNSNVQGIVSVFDTATATETTAEPAASGVVQEAPLNLDEGLENDTVNFPRLFLTNPVAMAWRPD